MSNQHNLPLLISVVVLVFLMVLVGVSSALTLTSTREDAFRIEATNVLKASKEATRKLEDEKIKLLNNSQNCQVDENRYCYTISYLVNNKLYDGDSERYVGKVIFDKENVSYELYLKKNDEFRIIAGSSTDYTKSGILAREEWKEEYEICECQ